MTKIKLDIPKELLMDFVRNFPKTTIQKVVKSSSRIEVIANDSVTKEAIAQWLSNQ